jgi:hypothetical protein
MMLVVLTHTLFLAVRVRGDRVILLVCGFSSEQQNEVL